MDVGGMHAVRKVVLEYYYNNILNIKKFGCRYTVKNRPVQLFDKLYG